MVVPVSTTSGVSRVTSTSTSTRGSGSGSGASATTTSGTAQVTGAAGKVVVGARMGLAVGVAVLAVL